MPSLLQAHINAWKNCQRCPLHKGRKKVCTCRGEVPADVLFIGEAPGESEDCFGLPFYGPAGKLLDQLIEKAEKQVGEKVSKCWTNLVGCIPKTLSPERKKVEPLPEEIDACYPRLSVFIDICKPKLIVAVGEMATEYGEDQHWEEKAKVVSIIHPAAILRMKTNKQLERIGMALQRTEVTLRDAFNDMLCPF